jgi:hypothetical protein
LILTDHDRSNIDEFDNIVTVLVGAEEKRFILHQDLVCAKSKFFKVACSNRWREGQERIVRLPEAEAATFKVYSTWIYSGDIEEDACTPTSDKRDRFAAQTSLIKLYLLGDTLDDIQLRNRTIRMLSTSVKRLDAIPGISNVDQIWESTVSGSLLRKMIIDLFIWIADHSYFVKSIHRFPASFVQEVAVASLGALGTKDLDNLAENFQQYTEPENPE